MSGQLDYSNRRADLEMEIGVDPIEDLQHRRRECLKRLAPLKARFGPGGTWDADRKRLREAIMWEIKVDAVKNGNSYQGVKLTDSTLEAAAASDPRYANALKEAESGIVEYIQLANEERDLSELISRDQALVQYVARRA